MPDLLIKLFLDLSQKDDIYSLVPNQVQPQKQRTQKSLKFSLNSHHFLLMKLVRKKVKGSSVIDFVSEGRLSILVERVDNGN